MRGLLSVERVVSGVQAVQPSDVFFRCVKDSIISFYFFALLISDVDIFLRQMKQPCKKIL